MPSFDSVRFWITVSLLLVTLVTTIVSNWKKLQHLWKTRHLRKVWGIKDGDAVIVVCSELENPGSRQWVEPREFIYNLKYGDVDAYIEVMITLFRLYPTIKLRVMSAGEANSIRLDFAKHFVVIGGSDYNAFTMKVLNWGETQFEYRSPDMDTQSTDHPDEIVIYDKVNKTERCFTTETRDFGYFERIINRHNPDTRIILIGGCHTIGVTGAIKAFSMVPNEEGEIHPVVLRNAKLVKKKVGKNKCFSVLVEAELISETISVPVVRSKDITVNSDLNA